MTNPQNEVLKPSYPRHRTRGGFTTPQTVLWGNSTPTNNSTTIYVGTYEEMDDIVVPDFKRLQAEGKIIMNAMGSFKETRSHSSIGPRFINGTAWLDYGQNWMGAVLPVVLSRHYTDGSSIRDEVITLARSRVMQPDFNGLVALGELRENLQYLRNPLKEAFKLATHFQKRKLVYNQRLSQALGKATVYDDYGYYLRGAKEISKRTKGIIKDIESLYLSVRYGMRPLVMDVSNLMDTLSFPRVTPRERATAKKEVTTGSTTTSTPTISSITYNYTDTMESSTSVHAGLLYQHELEIYRDRWGLGFSEVFLTAWNLIPLSFVADWFLNVGTFIRSVEPSVSGNILGTYISERSETTVKRVYNSASFNTAGWSTSRQPTGSYTTKWVSYSRNPHLPNASIVVKKDAFLSFAKDFGRVADLFSLIHQRIR